MNLLLFFFRTRRTAAFRRRHVRVNPFEHFQHFPSDPAAHEAASSSIPIDPDHYRSHLANDCPSLVSPHSPVLSRN